MSLSVVNEIIGFEDGIGVFCPQCWKLKKRRIEDTVLLVTASSASETEETIVCDKCGDAIWE